MLTNADLQSHFTNGPNYEDLGNIVNYNADLLGYFTNDPNYQDLGNIMNPICGYFVTISSPFQQLQFLFQFLDVCIVLHDEVQYVMITPNTLVLSFI